MSNPSVLPALRITIKLYGEIAHTHTHVQPYANIKTPPAPTPINTRSPSSTCASYNNILSGLKLIREVIIVDILKRATSYVYNMYISRMYAKCHSQRRTRCLSLTHSGGRVVCARAQVTSMPHAICVQFYSLCECVCLGDGRTETEADGFCWCGRVGFSEGR